jgi:hypothetical protein
MAVFCRGRLISELEATDREDKVGSFSDVDGADPHRRVHNPGRSPIDHQA